MASGLIKNNFPLHFLDLNLQLNTWNNGDGFLSKDTLEFLENWDRFLMSSCIMPNDLNSILERIVNIISNGKFSYIALSLNRITTDQKVNNTTFGFASLLSRILRDKLKCPSMAGGQVFNWLSHKTILRSFKMHISEFYDYIFYDDGALSLPLLLLALDNKYLKIKLKKHIAAYSQRIFDCKNFTFYSGTNIKPNKPRANKNKLVSTPPIENKLLDISPSFEISNGHLYPFTIHSVFPISQKYRWTLEPITIVPYKFIYGCTHKCAFCKTANCAPTYKSAGLVVNDIKNYVDKNGFKNFRFLNSQINFSDNYVKNICKLFIKNKLNIQFSDSASLRNLSKDSCLLLREAGCIKLWFGVESPNDRILKMIHKEINVETIEKSLKNAHEAGIWIGVNLIIGFPHETEKEYRNLLSFVSNFKEIVNCWQISPLELHKKTSLFQNPRFFRIKIHSLYPKEMEMLGYAFSEENGLCWKERFLQSKERTDKCCELINSTKNRFYSNDYLTFALYKELRSKKDVLSTFNKYIRRIKNEVSLREAAKCLTIKDVHTFNYFDFLKLWEKKHR